MQCDLHVLQHFQGVAFSPKAMMAFRLKINKQQKMFLVEYSYGKTNEKCGWWIILCGIYECLNEIMTPNDKFTSNDLSPKVSEMQIAFTGGKKNQWG